MDKVRVIVGAIWRERFWVLIVIGVLAAVGCWYISAAELDKEFASRKSSINGTFSSMQKVSREIDHPNSEVIQGDKQQARLMRDNVLKQWEELYAVQRDTVLKWPADNLKAEFIEAIEQLKFRDKFPPRLANNMRSEYSNYIGKRFDGLLEIVQAKKIEGSSPGGGGRNRFGGGYPGGDFREGGGERGRNTLATDAEEEDDYLVEWLDQGNLRDKLDFETKPTSMQIWVTQEDLWVYETLLNVIAATNRAGGTTRPDNASVRVIMTLEVGREAALASGRNTQIIMPGGASDGGREGGYGRDESGYGRSEGGYGRGEGRSGQGELEEITDEEVLANRYLNAEGEPYPGEPEDPEFRRLPIVMELVMDQRWLPQLLVECANADLPVEVDQVSINPESSNGIFGGAISSVRSRTPTSRTTNVDSKSDPNVATVLISGVVYIYNEPDQSVLSMPGLDEPGQENLQALN